MRELPTIAHVTLTVSDLERSVRWYERIFDVKMFWTKALGHFYELCGSSEVKRSSDFTSFPTLLTPFLLMNGELVWTTWRSPAGVEVISRHGRSGSTNSVSPAVGLLTRITVLRRPAVAPIERSAGGGPDGSRSLARPLLSQGPSATSQVGGVLP